MRRFRRNAVGGGWAGAEEATQGEQLERARKYKVEREIAEVRRGQLRLEFIQKAVLLVLTVVFVLGVGLKAAFDLVCSLEPATAAMVVAVAVGGVGSWRPRSNG